MTLEESLGNPTIIKAYSPHLQPGQIIQVPEKYWENSHYWFEQEMTGDVVSHGKALGLIDEIRFSTNMIVPGDYLLNARSSAEPIPLATNAILEQDRQRLMEGYWVVKNVCMVEQGGIEVRAQLLKPEGNLLIEDASSPSLFFHQKGPFNDTIEVRAYSPRMMYALQLHQG